MTFGLLNTLMLLGLAGMAIPPLIHLLNRRRFTVVDWGAMQFLQMSETTRRRVLLEEVLLMLLRMGLIAVMVLALAAPYALSSWFARVGARGSRDVVILVDGSYSMGFTGGDNTPQERAREWATALVDRLSAGDSVAVLQAKQQVVPVIGEPTHDLERVRNAIAHLPDPGGGCDWPQALRAAHQILAQSKQPRRDIIVLSDGQRFGWADETSLLGWEMLAKEFQDQPAGRPGIYVVNLDPDRPADPPNWSLMPLRASRAVAPVGKRITFHTALALQGQTEEFKPPYQIRLEVDGRPVPDFKPLLESPGKNFSNGQVPWSFDCTFPSAGSHLVSVTVDPDPPSAGPRARDQLPGDNRQDLAVEVVEALPVLLVDGDTSPSPRSRGTDFLRDALAPARDRNPVVVARVVPVQDFDPGLLTHEIKGAGTRPRVLVLSNVPRLTPPQKEGIDQFLTGGGGVLVTLGERVDVKYYNEHLHCGGEGWLPAQLTGTAGDETDEEHAANPVPSSFFHPALDLFRKVKAGGLAEARFPRWWKVTTPGRSSLAVPVALLTSHDPLFVERPYHTGRVLLCTVPLDNSWRTNLTDLPAFAPLAHELVYYLAGARSAQFNLQPGQPLHYRPDGEESPATLSLQPPEGEVKALPTDSWPLDYKETRETGVYRLTAADGRLIYYVVQSDHRESELTPSSEDDRNKVSAYIPMIYQNDREQLAAALSSPDQKQELWWWFLLGVVLLLCSEVYLTRRIVKGRS